MIGRVAALLFALVWAPAALARDVTFTGSFVQGGLVVAHAPGATEAVFDGRTLPIAPDGTFVFGLAPDAKSEAPVVLRYADGASETQVLKVARQVWKVERVNGLPPETVNPPPAIQQRINAENAKIAKARADSAASPWFLAGFDWPVTGRISGVFGSRRVLNGQEGAPHWGLDVAAPTGAPVRAPAPGRVVLAEPDFYLSGGTVLLDHGFGVSSSYSHLSKVTVKVGDEVKQGEPIGAVGATGRVTGAHLHWTMNWYNVRIDPALVVPPMPQPGG